MTNRPATRIKPGPRAGCGTSARALLVGRIVMALITAVMLGVIGRVAQLQIAPPPQVQRLVNSQRSKEQLLARRANLLDRRSRVIASTRVAGTLFVDPQMIREPNTFSEVVGYTLGYDPAEIERKIDARLHTRYVLLDRELTDERAAALKDLKLPGLGSDLRLVREYPLGTAAGQVIGFVGVDGTGLEGLELVFNDTLTGRAGSLNYWRDARRRPLWVQSGSGAYRPPVDGEPVRLSLDAAIQSFAEQALANTCRGYDAESGQIIVMHPFTGEILAMANYPNVDPRTAGNMPPDLRRNRSVTDVFEPGSTFKPFIWAAATQQQLAKPEELIDCHMGFYVSPRGRRLRDVHGYGKISWDTVLIKSSNIGMAIVGQRMGSQRLYEAVRNFGFGRSTDSGLPGEIAGLVNPLPRWTHYSETSVPMGQEIGVTALQLARGYSALANGGYLITPTILAADADSPSPIKHQVISTAVANHTRQVMRLVVTEGTGQKAKSDLYEIFGKTGTAQVPDRVRGGYTADKYTAVFAGGGPVNDPQVVVVTVIHQPDKRKGYYGGIVAAPPSKQVIEQTLAYLGVTPTQPQAPPKPLLARSGH